MGNRSTGARPPLLLLLMLAGCATQPRQPLLGTGPPSDNFAQTALSDGAPAMALSASTGILQARPGDETALLVQAEAYAALGRTQEAQAGYRAVLARDPASAPAARGLGRLLLASDPAAAEAMFQQAIARDARDAAALNDLGIARDLQGHHAEAQAAYREALAVTPDMPAATANLALSLSLTGHAAEGMQMLRPLAVAADAPQRMRYDLAAVATLAGERQEAAAMLKADLTPQKLQDALDGFAALAPASP